MYQELLKKINAKQKIIHDLKLKLMYHENDLQFMHIQFAEIKLKEKELLSHQSDIQNKIHNLMEKNRIERELCVNDPTLDAVIK